MLWCCEPNAPQALWQERKTGEHGDLSAKKGMQDSDGACTLFCKGDRFGSVRAAFLFDLAPSVYHAEAARSGSYEHYAVAGVCRF